MSLSKLNARWQRADGTIDEDGFFRCMEEKDKEEVPLHLYFTPEELNNICDYEKLRLKNVYRNYQMMKELGIAFSKPDFMCKKKKQESSDSSSSDNDKEWLPSSKRKRKKITSTAAAIRKWTKGPPKKRIPKVTVDKDSDDEDEEVHFRPVSDDDGETGPFTFFTKEQVEQSNNRMLDLKRKRKRVKRGLTMGYYTIEDCLEILPLYGDLDEWYEYYLKAKEEKEKSKKKRTKKKIDWKNPTRRYPRRNIPKVNYAKVEVPPDDAFLWCDKCEDEYLDSCPVHGSLTIIEDVNADELKGVLDIYAVNTAPLGITIQQSGIPDAGCGAFVTHGLAQDVRLGPYEGKTVKLKYEHEVQENGFAWLVFDDNDKPSHYIDASDDSQSSWMRYVNCARVFEEQNLMAFQYLGNIYYRTIRPVKAGEELLVWYGDEYAKELGIVDQQEKKICVEIEKPSEKMEQAKQKLLDWKQHGSKIEDVPSFFPVPVPKGFQCDVCSICFTTAEFLHKHRKSSHRELRKTGREKYKCQYCQYATNKKHTIIEHERIHTGEKPHVCTVCRKRFNHKDHLTSHMRTHTGERPYKCSTCGKRFSHSGNLRKHELTHVGRMFCCLYCDLKFTRQGNLKRHVSAVHGGEKKYQCNHCDYKCSQSSSLKRHIANMHTDDYIYTCHVCGKGFNGLREIKHHIINVHKQDLPHACQFCSDKFVLESQLQRHMVQYHYTHLTDEQRRHYAQSAKRNDIIETWTKEKEFDYSNNANICQPKMEAESRAVSLDAKCTGSNRESRNECTFDVNSKHACTQCVRSFTSSRGLRHHIIAIHTKEYPYHCKVCNMGAVSSYKLKRHMNIHSSTYSSTDIVTPSKQELYACAEKRQPQEQMKNVLEKENVHSENCEESTNVPTKESVSSVTFNSKHTCTQCGKSLSSAVKLREHIIAIHTKDYPFHCEVCNRGLVSRGELNRHMKVSHNETKDIVGNSKDDTLQSDNVNQMGVEDSSNSTKRKIPSTFTSPPCKIAR